MNDNNQSEVARLMRTIQAEHEAAYRALYDLALGTAQHSFITARMERIGKLGEELKDLVGDREEGTRLLITALDALPPPP